VGIIQELPQANWIAFAVGAGALALLFLLPRWNKKIPGGLVVLFGAIGLSAALDLNAKYGVAVVGVLPQGLPTFAFPSVSVDAFLWMILPAIGVLLVAYSESIGVAREFAEKHGYEVGPDQELNAHALANIASSLFGGMIAGGSMSASAVKEGAGARSQVTNLVTWIITVITVLFLTPLFASLPEAVLAALIIHAVWHIVASRKLQRIRLVSRTEFWFGMVTFAGVILIDVLEGMIIGLVCSLIFVIYHSSRPHIASLGRVPDVPGAYSDLARHAENTKVPGVMIVRLDGAMYYANALTVRDQIKTMIEEAKTQPRALLIDLDAQDRLDLTSADVLKGLLKELQGKGIAVYVADMHAPVREFGQRTGLLELIGEDHIFPTVDAAVRFLETAAG
jgi:anti-anti-sigma factor